MNKAISLQQLAVVPARRRAATLEPPVQANPPAQNTTRTGSDRVTISDTARAQQGGAGVGPSLQTSQAPALAGQLQQALDGLRSTFFSKAGDDRFDASFDFNDDGVINTSDLAMLREKLSHNAPVSGPQPPQADPQPAAPTLQELRDAFFSRTGDENFNAAADMNRDGVVNTSDLALFRRRMGTPVTPPDVQVTPPQTAVTQTGVAGDAQPTQPVPGVIVADPATPSGVKSGEPVATEPLPDSVAATHEAPTRDSVLAQLRAAFFSTQGDDRFDAALDANGDGVINVRDFVAARFAAHGLSRADD